MWHESPDALADGERTIQPGTLGTRTQYPRLKGRLGPRLKPCRDARRFAICLSTGLFFVTPDDLLSAFRLASVASVSVASFARMLDSCKMLVKDTF